MERLAGLATTADVPGYALPSIRPREDLRFVSQASPDRPLIRSTPFAEVAWDGRMVRIRFSGPTVGQTEVPAINDAISEVLSAAGDGLRLLVLDLEQVEAISSMGLGLCIATRHEAARRKAPSVLFRVRDDLLDLFRLMKIDRMFRHCPTERELAEMLGD